jgi:formate-dependent nitrite reductase cytochrome c552 subunit
MPARRNQRPTNVAYYAANREREIERVTRRQAATTAFLRELREVPCTDCGGRFAGHQMDFDHRDPNEKSFDMCSSRAALKNRTQLLAEAAKCDVVCANCHRLRSRRRHREWLRSRTPSDAPRTEAHRLRWRYHAEVLDQLRSVPCADCGGRFAQCSMDFDHRDPSTKVMRVTLMVGRAGIDRILAEVAKCDIVCANCHRLRTFERRRSEGTAHAGVAQLVERQVSNLDVAGSNPAARSTPL